MDPIKSCPFCGSNDVRFNTTKPETSKIPPMYWVTCDSCDGCGGHSPKKQRALELWNQRENKEVSQWVSNLI